MTPPPPQRPLQRPPYAALTLLLLYPLLLLLAQLLGRSWISALAAIDLVTLLLLGALARGNRTAWTAWTLAVTGTLWLMQRQQAEIVLLLVPVAINAGMAWFFGRTLLAGRRPLVARAILAFEGEQRLAQPGVRDYAHSLTIAWTLLLGTQALVMLTCAIGATPGGIFARLGLAVPFAVSDYWANWYLHLGGFVVIGLFSLAEFAWRHWHLRHLAHDSPRRYFGKVVQNWRRVLHDGADGD
ncbi:MAG TPA: xanthomonadin biosynthesis protein [Tahibacter sp.]|uniref:xanthomonadin biosynthesis protein n=1 Tax=Tahibacter sp. TaxID=2056211 RepID=UPI002BB6F1F3|nr:xanthomonadin biosynthesis protein [Tahibacter sp.]HSX58843.1 xanthomonadin biosynthesis protein [Tahibacter sp.]